MYSRGVRFTWFDCNRPLATNEIIQAYTLALVIKALINSISSERMVLISLFSHNLQEMREQLIKQYLM